MLRPRSLRTTRPTADTSPETVHTDYSGIPTLICPCGSTLIKIVVSLDEDTYEIADYTLTGYCYMCEARLTILCPADHPDHNSSNVTV